MNAATGGRLGEASLPAVVNGALRRAQPYLEMADRSASGPYLRWRVIAEVVKCESTNSLSRWFGRNVTAFETIRGVSGEW